MNNKDEIVIYQSQDGNIKVDVLFTGDTVWLTQFQIATLFGKAKSTISEHIKNIFDEGELDEKVVVRNFRTTTRHGAIEDKTQTHDVNYYNLDVIISVGYRVKSLQGTQFRIWATQRLHDYIIKGFALNDERFKRGSSMNYFNELLNRIREIRLSEKVFYQQIKDIYATSIDYNPSDEVTQMFYKEAQAISHTPMYMKDWIEKLKQVLTMNNKNILEHVGRISHELALQKASDEYDKYISNQKQMEHLDSIKELEQDIKKLGKK